MARLLLGAIACGGVVGSGCVSTQDKNARARIVASRELDSRRAQRVTRPSRDVRVTDVALVRGRGATAFVVTLRSRAAHALADVPVTVGVRGRDGRRTALNAGRGLDWFQTHAPVVAAGGSATWVFLTRRPVEQNVRPWAQAGTGVAVGRGGAQPPRIEATVLARPSASGRRGERSPARVRVAIVNASDIPQYGLQVYALVGRDGRWTAAGKTAVRHLGTGGRTTAAVALAGEAAASARTVRVHAVPTIFE